MTDQMTQVDPNDWLMSGGGMRSASFLQVGATITGFIMRPPDMVQARDFQTGKPKYWDNGDKVMQQRVVLMTEERDPQDPDDSGERALYIRGGVMQKAVADAVRAVKAPGLEVGGKLQVRYTGDGQASRSGQNPPKLYAAQYRRPDPVAVPVHESAPPASNGKDEVPF